MVCFLPARTNKERRTGQIRGASFRDAHTFGRLDAGSRASFTSSKPPPPWTSVYFIFSYFCMTCGLEKLRLVDGKHLERDLPALLLRTLAVGRRQQFESIGVALGMQ